MVLEGEERTALPDTRGVLPQALTHTLAGRQQLCVRCVCELYVCEVRKGAQHLHVGADVKL